MKKFKNKFNLKRKNIYIIGGSGLIGKKIVEACLQFGGKVIVLDIKKPKIKNKRLKYINYNCANSETSERLYSQIIKLHGCPNVYINASYPKTKDWKLSSFENINYKSFKENLNAHLSSFAWLSKLTANEMKKRNIKGSIINIGSIYGVVGQDLSLYKGIKSMRENFTYSLIKGAIINLTKQMASYYGKHNIRVNCISPGGVSDIGQSRKFIKNYSNKVPMKRLAKPEEVASGVIFLASDSSSYVTGINLLIDGGWTSI